ncbi:MAG: Fe-S protein assembly co-chaperone HscB [Alphaproteobacteria bacterium]|nr:Fe-S protein assembly co-chaperone HscB [Alphaproteobacteria bacterium]
MDHFARLGLEATLELDGAALDKAYFAAQRRWHPDRFVTRPAEERARASLEAAAVNDAYRTLREPVARAVYLGSLSGVEMPGDGRTIDDPDLLMQAMEDREELAECAAIERVDALASRARDTIARELAALGGFLLHDDKGAIRKTLLRLRYLEKFLEETRARRINLERVGPAR